ncbi:DUF4956 domain-containing protein [Alphaproteobacteria bacterium]|nr:DUF4956 domain-containing protein [Alphaproteobacteria bacterium]
MDFSTAQFEVITLQSLIINVIIGTVLSFILRWHYINYGRALSNREVFSAIFPFIAITTLLIITVVKSSLALSLGLIGALSIIRFRTPIKEPEELAYLFIAISIGIGLGANYILGTITVVLFLLLIMGFYNKRTNKNLSDHLYLTINLINDNESSEKAIEVISNVLNKYTTFSDLHRMNIEANHSEFTYFIDIDKLKNVQLMVNEIKNIYPKANINLLDQKRLPGV